MGYCWPCVNFDGAIYFAASAHICIGLMMTGYLAYVFLHISVAHGFHGDYSFFLMLMLYALTFLIVGLFIYRGLEKKSVRILKPATLTFGIIHAIIFLRVVYVILSKLVLGMPSYYPPTYSKSGTEELSSDTFGIIFFTFLFFGTVIYLALLAIHIRNLQTLYPPNNVFSQVNLGANEDGNPLYAYNTVLCHP